MVKVKRAFISFGLVSLLYLAALVWVDSKNRLFAGLPMLWSAMPVLVVASLLSYLIRYTRWYWLLFRAGNKTSLMSGFLAYLSGFAFTATPGKVGELLRIRYLTPQGISPSRVVAAFVYERSFDLIAVLLLSALAISRNDIFVFVLCFIVIFLAGLLFAALNPAWLTRASAYLRFYQLKKLVRICMTLRDGLRGCRTWATPLDVIVSMFLGVLAWSLTAFSFVWVLNHLGVSIPTLPALAIYPLAMLAGAASMLPGGVGSTEATIVALLTLFEVPPGTAMLAAVGIRFSSMWFAVLCGFVAMIALELQAYGSDRMKLLKTTGLFSLSEKP